MGNSNQKKSGNADNHSRTLDQKIADHHNIDSTVKKLLLLGAGESGKSTILKQMVALYGNGYDEASRMTYLRVIYTNLLESINVMLVYSNETKDESCKIQDKDSIEYFDKISIDSTINAEVAKTIAKLWSDPGMKNCYNNRSNFQLPDSINYFFDKVEQFNDDYIPTYEDVLRVRARTTGINETSFDVQGMQFKLIDVGGQRNERRKWIHCFEGVTAILFVVALSEYDQVLFEDDQQNRLVEAIKLFEQTSNLKWFKDSSCIIFFNKRDLYKEKIKEVPLTKCPLFNNDSGFKGDPHSYDDGIEHLKKIFAKKCMGEESECREVYSHVTCAMDSDNVKHVFEAVKDTVLRRSLKDGGLDMM